MKKILVTIDENTTEKIEKIKETESKIMGLKLNTSEIIRVAIHKLHNELQPLMNLNEETRKIVKNCIEKELQI